MSTQANTAEEYTPIQQIRFQRSLWLLYAVAFIHGCGLIALLLSDLPLWLTLLMSPVLLLQLGAYCYRWHRLPEWRLMRQDRHWQWVDPHRPHRTLQIIDCPYRTAWLIVLRVTEDRAGIRYFPIAPDSCTKAGFHRLQLLAQFDFTTIKDNANPPV